MPTNLKVMRNIKNDDMIPYIINNQKGINLRRKYFYSHDLLYYNKQQIYSIKSLKKDTKKSFY